MYDYFFDIGLDFGGGKIGCGGSSFRLSFEVANGLIGNFGDVLLLGGFECGFGNGGIDARAEIVGCWVASRWVTGRTA